MILDDLVKILSNLVLGKILTRSCQDHPRTCKVLKFLARYSPRSYKYLDQIITKILKRSNVKIIVRSYQDHEQDLEYKLLISFLNDLTGSCPRSYMILINEDSWQDYIKDIAMISLRILVKILPRFLTWGVPGNQALTWKNIPYIFYIFLI